MLSSAPEKQRFDVVEAYQSLIKIELNLPELDESSINESTLMDALLKIKQNQDKEIQYLRIYHPKFMEECHLDLDEDVPTDIQILYDWIDCRNYNLDVVNACYGRFVGGSHALNAYVNLQGYPPLSLMWTSNNGIF